MTSSSLYIDRPRYRKIVRFFGGAILHFAFLDVLLGRIPGVRWAILQGRELLERGAPGIHFYTLNRSPATRRVYEGLAGR